MTRSAGTRTSRTSRTTPPRTTSKKSRRGRRRPTATAASGGNAPSARAGVRGAPARRRGAAVGRRARRPPDRPAGAEARGGARRPAPDRPTSGSRNVPVASGNTAGRPLPTGGVACHGRVIRAASRSLAACGDRWLVAGPNEPARVPRSAAAGRLPARLDQRAFDLAGGRDELGAGSRWKHRRPVELRRALEDEGLSLSARRGAGLE